MRSDGVAWQSVITHTPSTNYQFTGQEGHTYAFRVRARDRATNTGAWSDAVTTTVDTLPPVSSATSPATSESATFEVAWSGTDATSGIATYDVQVQVDGGEWQPVLTQTQSTSYQFTGLLDHTYAFRVRARDVAGNVEAWRAQADTTTAVVRTVTKYYYHGGTRVALRRAGVVYYLHGDHLGSTSLTTDAGGQVVARQLYHPYGIVRHSEGTLPTDFGFAGQRHDGTGLVYMHARYYHAGLGRFVSADTVVPEAGNSQALNRYLYVANNPLRFVDPTGHSWLTDHLVALGQRSSVVRGLLVSTAEAVEALNDPVRSPTMEGIRQTAHGVTEGARAWGDAAGMAGVAVDYTATAISEGRWDDAARGATGLGQMGQTVNNAVQQATGQAVLGIATAPFRDAWAFGVAAREYAAGERSGWDLAFHSLCLTGDVLAIGAVHHRLATPTSRTSPNPYGRLGGPQHQAAVEQVRAGIRGQGLTPKTEFRVFTAGGHKPYRLVDVAALDASGNPVAFYQVGRITRGGLPVAREIRAISDIFEFGGYNVPIHFIPYYP